jgi:hypothetical protein
VADKICVWQMIFIHERRFEKPNFLACEMIFSAFFLFSHLLIFCSKMKKKLDFTAKKIKKLIFSFEKESQWTNVDDYHPL